MTDSLKRLTAANLWIAHLALFFGIVTGLFQALDHAGVNLYGLAALFNTYYQGLSVHGTLNALVWTFFFINGFIPFILVRSLERPLASIRLGWATYGVSVLGLLLAAVPLLHNDATVMFTFYPPLKASWAFYVGLTLVVVSTWLVLVNMVVTYRQWRREHPTERTPLPAFMCLVTYVMWTVSSLGVAVEMLYLLIPWSLGMRQGVDALLGRTLFWFTGHPIVYFWLLPAYVSWYTLIPRQVGGKLFSDPLSRAAFILFLLLSNPVGLHHQYTDPGITQGWKLLHAFMTFGVFFPSLLTFFTITASLESGGRARGARGWVDWFAKLPWDDPSVAAQVCAMLLFAFGGIGGLINSSYNVNLTVHNTAWVPGHLHLTVGSAVTLTFIGISYWLVPYLAGRPLWSRNLALTQVALWFGGMIVFSHYMHELGLMGMPRRTSIALAPYVKPEWHSAMFLVGVGGTVLFVSGMLYFLQLLLTVTVSKGPAPEVPAFAVAKSGPEESPPILDRWWPWLCLLALFLIGTYGPLFYSLFTSAPLITPGYRVW